MKRLLLVTMMALTATVAAGEENKDMLNRVEFQVQADRDADNDLGRATLVVDKENSDPARLADDVNQTMAWALQQAKAQKAVRVQSGGYRTYPVYEQQRVIRWRAEQELVLESRDVQALNQLAGRLQDRLQVRAMSFTVSEERQREVESALIGTALDDFRTRADAISRRLGAHGYDIVHLQVQNTAAQPPPPILVSRAMAVPAENPIASEPGSSRITIAVRAVIRLRY
jgi:predicted secreted protein